MNDHVNRISFNILPQFKIPHLFNVCQYSSQMANGHNLYISPQLNSSLSVPLLNSKPGTISYLNQANETYLSTINGFDQLIKNPNTKEENCERTINIGTPGFKCFYFDMCH
jgi:hypothetical protein